MINVLDKHNCVGCRGCEQICPKHCISISTDSEGFKYPIVDIDKCIDCHLCEKVCPVLIDTDSKKPLMALGCKAKSEEIQLRSSSGGIFSIIAGEILSNNGLVYGASFDEEFRVKHICVDNIDDIDTLRRSKYVQSDTSDTFNSVKKNLEAGRVVLYCGTPCQIKGLKLFLRKQYDNLIAVDFVCHGVPSPKVWQDYLYGLCENEGMGISVESVNFRSKSAGGWHNFALEFHFKDKDGHITTKVQHPHDNPYHQLFSQDISLRPSCYKCPAKGFSSGSDLTLADFWGVQKVAPDFDDNNGVSLVFINTEKGKSLVDSLSIKRKEVDVASATKSNPSVYRSVSEPPRRVKFFRKSDFTLQYLKKHSGTDVYGRTRRWVIEQLMKVVKL